MTKTISNYPNYLITSKGEVFNKKTGKKLKPQFNSKGYVRVFLSKDGHDSPLAIHRLVAEAFIPRTKGRNEVNHIDLDKTNNDVSNLEWCSRSENIYHALANGRGRWFTKGES